MFFDSEIDMKLTNSAKLLPYKNKEIEIELFSNGNYQINKIKNINIKKTKEIKFCDIQNMTYKNNLSIFEKYTKIYFNNKYSNDSNFYNVKVINDIISNEPTHVVAEFKDYLIYGDDSEFLHDIYNLNESKKYLPKLFDYYMKCSVIFPNYVVFPENKYIFKNIQRKQKLIDFQLEQENKKEQILKGEIDFDDNDDLFSTRTLHTILNQTDTSNIKKLFGMKKESKKEVEDISLKKLVGVIKDEEKKNKRKKKIISKIMKKQQLLNIKSGIKLKFKSKIIDNINLKINIKGRNNNIKDDMTNCNNKNKVIFYTNTNSNMKNCTINNSKKISKNIRFITNPKSKVLNNIELNNYMNYKNSNITKIKNKNFIYSLINDSKINHISANRKSNGKKSNLRNQNQNNNINHKLNNNSSGKSKKTIQEYFKRKMSPKAIIIKILTERNNNNNIISPNSKSKKKKKEKDNFIVKKKPSSLTPSIQNMKMASHKTKKIYNRNEIIKNNSTSIINTKRKNKIFENKIKIIDRKFRFIKIKEANNSNSNYNTELINNNNNNYNNKNILNNNFNNKINTNYSNNNIINNILKKENSMNLYKVKSFSNIKKTKDAKKNSKTKCNKNNSTLTGTTTCSNMKHSSIYYDKKTSKPINKKHIFYRNKILINEPNNKIINKKKYHNNIFNQFSINSSISNINLNSNKVNIKTENSHSKYFSKNILSTSPSIGNITEKKNYLYQKALKKYSGIFPIRKEYCKMKINGSPFTSRMSHDTSRTRIMKSTINNDKRCSKYENKNNLKNINNSLNLKSVKNIKAQRNYSKTNKRVYLATYYGYFKPKK